MSVILNSIQCNNNNDNNKNNDIFCYLFKITFLQLDIYKAVETFFNSLMMRSCLLK